MFGANRASSGRSSSLRRARNIGRRLKPSRNSQMSTRTLIAAAVVASFTIRCSADQWVDKMLTVHEHDFGTVARSADTVYKFPVKNIYKQDVQLSSVRASCGCTTPTLENSMLKPGETGYIVATFNTRTFTGNHA